MSTYMGFGELNTPRDLLCKLEYDLKRMKESPQDQYAAFDFFVTAEHIVDWIHSDSKSPNDNKNSRNDLRSNEAVLRITSHIANGGKHFRALAGHHTSVKEVKKERYFKSGYIEEGYTQDPLMVHLDPEEAKAIGAPEGASEIDATRLAHIVLEYWRANILLRAR